MTDYKFPLPKNALTARYRGLFEAIKNGLSACLIGLPLSSRSAYLKFILDRSSSENFIDSLIESENYKFLIIETKPLTSEILLKELCVQLLSLNVWSEKETEELCSYLKLNDLLLLRSSLIENLKKLTSIKIVIIFYEAEKQILDKETSDLLGIIWKVNRSLFPNPLIRLLFIGSPTLLEIKNTPIWNPLHLAVEESINFFPLLDQSEMDYSKKRIESLSKIKIPSAVHKSALMLSGGHYHLYKSLISLSAEELNQLESGLLSPNPLEPIIKEILDGFPYLARQNWSKEMVNNHPVLSKLALIQKDNLWQLPKLISNSKTEQTGKMEMLPQLTAQQKLVFDFLINRTDQVINRDEISQIIWGKLWQEKYSDWALDRTMCLLRKKLSPTKYKVITIRNRGYKLNTL